MSRLDALLREVGAEPGRPLAVQTDSLPVLARLDQAAAALAVPVFPLDPALPAGVAADLVHQAGAVLAVGGAALSEAAVLSAAPGPVGRRAPADLAVLIATSGSTGGPRAVMLTAGALRAAAWASATRTPLAAGDRWLVCLPPFHIGGYAILGRCTEAGAQAVPHRGFDAESVLAALNRERITHLSVVPTMLAQMLAFAPPAPPALRHVLVGGAALPVDLAEQAAALGWPIQPTYGMSETASQVATLAALPRPWTRGMVGRPLPGFEAALTADGRLKLRGPTLMVGYANAALAPGDGLTEGWFVTNDLVEITEDGALVILGRADDVMISGGKKVLPAMVEALLAPCPGIAAVAVLGGADALWGAVVTAVYCGTSPPAEVLDWAARHLPGGLRPRRAVRVEKLPMLANGKIDRAALRRLVEPSA